MRSFLSPIETIVTLVLLLIAFVSGTASAQDRPVPNAPGQIDAVQNANHAVNNAYGKEVFNSQICTEQSGLFTPLIQKVFTIGGGVADEATVLFSGTGWNATSNLYSLAGIRLVVDGALVSNEVFVYGDFFGDNQQDSAGDEQFSEEPDLFNSHGHNFITPILSPGNHTVTIQWRNLLASGAGGSVVCVLDRTVTVLAR